MNQALKTKVDEAMKCSFVGSYIFTSEELSCLYDVVGKAIKSVAYERGETISTIYYNEIFVALVNLAKEWAPEEEAFFEYVYRRLLGSNDGNAKTYNQIVEVIQHLNKANKIFVFKSFKKKYYTTICSHAFAPLSSTNAFLDICWEIYCEDLNQQYIKNDPAFEYIADCLKNKFSIIKNDEDDFQIGSKSYSLRAGIKGLALDEKEKLIQLLDIAIKTIHSLFNNELIEYDNYFKTIIKNWWTKKELEFGISKTKRSTNQEFVIRDYSQINPKYIMTEGSINLLIPPFRLNGNFDFEPYLEVKVDGKILSCTPLQLKGSGILMATRTKEIDISEFKSLNIEVSITHCDKVIYNSKNFLNREFLLFNASGKEIIATQCVPNSYFLYINEFSHLLKKPSDLESIGIANTYSINASDGDILQTKNKEVFFLNEKSNQEISFRANKLGNIIYRMNNEDYCVIDGELYVEIYDTAITNKYGVKYEDIVFKLTDFECITINDRIRYCISSLLLPGDTQSISLFQYTDNTIVANIKLIKFNNIHINFDNQIYFGKPERAFVEFKTDKYYKKQEFIVGDDEVYIPINNGHIIVEPPLLKWKIDDGEWHTNSDDVPMWYKDITNSSILHIEAPKDQNVEIGINNDFVDRYSNKLSFKIGEYIYKQKETTGKNNFVVFAKLNGIKLFPLFKIYTKESFLSIPYNIESLSYKLLWNPSSFVGEKNAKFKIAIKNKTTTLTTLEVGLEHKIFDLSPLAEGYYNISVGILKKSFIYKEETLLNEPMVLGNAKNLKYKDKIVVLDSVFLFNTEERIRKIKPVYIESISYLGNINGYDYYSGVLFIKNKEDEKIYLNYMRKDDGSSVKINPIRFEYKSDTTCYLGYGLDINDKEYFEYDDDFTLNGFHQITIGKTTQGRKNLGIDYFRYEVKNV